MCRLLVAAFLAALFSPCTAAAQPGCEPEFEAAQQALKSFEPRSADSLATERVRGAWQRAPACYETLPELDSTAANNYARTFGREVQVLWETRRPDEATALTEAFLEGPHLRADSAGVRYLLEWRAFILDAHSEFEASAKTRLQLLDYAPSATPEVRTRIWTMLALNYSQLGWTSEALAIYKRIQDELSTQTDLSPGLRSTLARAYAKEAELRLGNKYDARQKALSLEAVRRAIRLLADGETSRERHHYTFAHITLAESFLAVDEPDSALVVAQRAVALADGLERPSPSAEVMAREVVARVLGDLDRHGEAVAMYEEALDLLETYEVDFRREAVLDYLARAYTEQGELARADTLLMRLFHIHEARRAQQAAEAEARRAVNSYTSALTLVGLRLRQGRVQDAFLTLDAGRARMLRDLRRRARSALLSLDRIRADSLAQVLEGLHRELSDMRLEPVASAGLRAQVEALESERDMLFGDFPDQEVSVTEMQQALAERDQVLLTYYFNAPAHAFVLRPDTLIAVPLDPDLDYERILTLLEGVSPQLNATQGPVAAAEASFDMRPLHDLYRLLFAPVAEHIPESTPLVVVPEGPMASFPFGLLLAEPVGRFAFEGAPFLLRRHAVTMELAAALLLEAPQADTAPHLVAFGRSEFSGLEEDSPLRSAYSDGEAPDLPSVRRELRMFGSRFSSAIVALNEKATESRFYSTLGDARVLHLASHAFVQEVNPLASYLQLTADADGSEDGRLHLYELIDQRLQAALVVLSGCRTARGRDIGGEGTLGLQYAVRAAGAESSLGMLWRVDDAATVELMDRFYKHLARGARKDVALQRAQVEYLDAHSGLRASPFFWAAPVLYGDPRPIPLPPSYAFSWWVGVGLLLLALLLPRLARRRA